MLSSSNKQKLREVRNIVCKILTSPSEGVNMIDLVDIYNLLSTVISDESTEPADGQRETVEIPVSVFKLIPYILEESTLDNSSIANLINCMNLRAEELMSRGDVMSDLTLKSGIKAIKDLKSRLDAVRSLAQTCVTEANLSDDTTEYIFTGMMSDLNVAKKLQSKLG